METIKGKFNQLLANIFMFIISLVDGGWSDWQNVTNCSTTCGEGVITQQRTCTQPSPSCGGRECLGENITNISCNNCCPGIMWLYKLNWLSYNYIS